MNIKVFKVLNLYITVPYVFCIFILCGLIVSCSKNGASDFIQPADQVYISVSDTLEGDPVTRTVIGGSSLDKVYWCETDRIGLYYNESSVPDVSNNTVFNYFTTYGGKTTFSATLNQPLSGSSYDYYALYPLPESVSGKTACFTLPVEQSGSYDAKYPNSSVMMARPVLSGGSLSDGYVPSFEFVHKCHIMRIQVPAGRNKWGADIRRIRVEFPQPVVGKLTVDMSDPELPAILSEGSNVVNAILSSSFSESEEDSPDGSYVWLFLAPCSIDGEVRFTAYDANGYQSETVSVNMKKIFLEGRITPVNLTIPNELPVSWMYFRISGNNLGEEVYRMKITAPEGARFRNGTDTMDYEVSSEGVYALPYYASYDGTDNTAALKSGDFIFEYESENAIVSEKLMLDTFPSEETSPKDLTVPYLFYEDFSGVSDRDGSNTTEMLDAYGLSGWSGSNYSISSEGSARMHAYLASAVLQDPDGGDNRRGRLDTPVLGNIKDGSTVNVMVSYRFSGTKADGTLSNCKILYSMYEFGIDSRKEAIEYTSTIERLLVQAEDAGTEGSYANVSSTKSLEVSGVTNENRLSWRTSFRVHDPNWWSALTAKTVYVYIDDIKVSIKK